MNQQRESLHSSRVVSGSVCYFLDVRQAVNGRFYLVLTESRRRPDTGFEQSRVIIFEESCQPFRSEVARALDIIEQLVEARPENHLSDIRSTHPRAFSRWTKQDEQDLADRFSNGGSIPSIAQALGRTEQAVRARLEKLGLIEPSPEQTQPAES